MRLLVVTNDFPPTVGGIENYIYSLVRRWPARDVVVLTRAVDGAEAFDAQQSFEIVREPVNTLLPTPRLVQKARKLLVDRDIEAVHFPSALPLGLMARSLDAPYVLSVHGGEFLLASRLPLARRALRAVCGSASIILPESTFADQLVGRVLGEGVARRRLTCGVDIDRYLPGAVDAVDLGVGGPVVACVSRLVARKGPRTLLRALPRVSEHVEDVHLLIVGDGPDREPLEKMAQALGIAGSVTFAGKQPWERIPAYLAAADVFALPTRTRFFGTETEGLPLVYLEAAAAGLPMIGGDAGGVSDAVREGETGFIVDGRRPEQVADSLLRLLRDPDLAAGMGAAARKMAEEEFGWDGLFHQYRDAVLTYCRR
ncbi:MAG: glycosyltransferase family 4 protein [Actinomycetota bacterium]